MLEALSLLLVRRYGIISDVITWRTHSKYSHVALRIGNDVYESTKHAGGFRKMRFADWKLEHPLWMPDNERAIHGFDTKVIRARAESFRGFGYDIWVFPSRIFGVNLNREHLIHCAEFVAMCLREMFALTPKEMHMLDAKDICIGVNAWEAAIKLTKTKLRCAHCGES